MGLVWASLFDFVIFLKTPKVEKRDEKDGDE